MVTISVSTSKKGFLTEYDINKDSKRFISFLDTEQKAYKPLV